MAAGDYAALVEAARSRPGAAVRAILSGLASAEEDGKWRAVAALGALAEDAAALPEDRLFDLLRRLFWAMNDESGAVPHGVPEAIGELLARRSEARAQFLPNLCSLVTSEEMSQTGVIERGVVWALGRVGAAVFECSPEAAAALAEMAQRHGDERTRETARWAAARVAGARRADRAG